MGSKAGPPPERPYVKWPNLGILPDDFEPSGPDLLRGPWVGSFSGFVHDLPADTNPKPSQPNDVDARPAQLPAYYLDGGVFTQTNGYYPFSTMMCLNFGLNNRLTGRIMVNRGGRKIITADDVKGEYNLTYSAALQVLHGNFETVYGVPSGAPTGEIRMKYYFIVKNENEIQWLWLNATVTNFAQNTQNQHRGSITQGTLARVLY